MRRGTAADFGIRAGARVIDTIAGLVLGFVVGIQVAVVIARLESAGVVEPG